LLKGNRVAKKHILLILFLFLLIFLAIVIYFSCSDGSNKNNQVILEFLMKVDKDIYEMTDFGEPPQIAIWLEDPETGKIHTVWVARRSGRRLWKGKFECPTALPLWESRHKNEKSSYKKRGILKRLIDAISGATPTGGIFRVKVEVDKGTFWDCFVEVNLSGDFNRRFPYRDQNGMPDPDVNGQPSLIYRGQIKAKPGQKHSLKLIGRTDQWIAIDYIIKDLAGITTARNAVSDLEIACRAL